MRLFSNFHVMMIDDDQGTYGTDGDSCKQCPTGTFASSVGSTFCEACTDCSEGQTNIDQPSQWAFCPDNEECVTAYRRPCSPYANSLCMSCSKTSWNLRTDNDNSRVCEACAPGYHYASDDHRDVVNGFMPMSARCIPCTANYYCPGKNSYEECQVTLLADSDFLFSPFSNFPIAKSYSKLFDFFAGPQGLLRLVKIRPRHRTGEPSSICLPVRLRVQSRRRFRGFGGRNSGLQALLRWSFLASFNNVEWSEGFMQGMPSGYILQVFPSGGSTEMSFDFFPR